MEQVNTRELFPPEDRFSKRLPIYRVLTLALITLAVVTCSVQQILRRDGDPYLFVHAARLFMQGQDIYTIPDQHGAYYYYPPFFAFVNIPLSFLPAALVVVLWSLASVFLLAWTMAAFYAGLTGQPFLSRPAKDRWVVCFFATLLTARFIILHLRFGSSNGLVLALAVLGLTLLARQKFVSAGIAIGFSMVVKLTTLPFGFWFLIRRDGRVLAGMVLAGLIGFLVPACVVGLRKDISYHREWLHQVVLFNAPGTGSWAGNGNLSPRAQADRFFLNVDAFVYKGKLYRVTIVELPPKVVRVIGQLLMLSVALGIAFYALRFRNAPTLVSQWGGFALIFSLMPSFSSVSLIPHLVVLLPAHIYVVYVWYHGLTTDRIFRGLVVLSFIFASLTTKVFVGLFLSRLLPSLGCVSFGLLLLSASIFRAAICIERSSKDNAGSHPLPDRCG